MPAYFSIYFELNKSSTIVKTFYDALIVVNDPENKETSQEEDIL